MAAETPDSAKDKRKGVRGKEIAASPSESEVEEEQEESVGRGEREKRKGQEVEDERVERSTPKKKVRDDKNTYSTNGSGEGSSGTRSGGEEE